MQQTCNSALCCTLFEPLYMDIVHEQCSWVLLKKKSTQMTPMNWRVTIKVIVIFLKKIKKINMKNNLKKNNIK